MNNAPTINKKALLFWTLVVPVALILRIVLLGGASVVTLPKASSLSGAISQSLAATGPTSRTLPVEGKDFVIKNLKYFSNGAWAVVSMTQGQRTQNTSLAVIYKSNQTYIIAAGPGTAFSSSQTVNMPQEVNQYLISLGAVIYDSPNQ